MSTPSAVAVFSTLPDDVGEWFEGTLKRTDPEILKNTPSLESLMQFTPEEKADLEKWAKENPDLL